MTLLERLKQETRLHHGRLEALVGLPATREDYIGRLERFYGFLAPWERRAVKVPGVRGEWFRGRLKTGWLLEDLHFFGRLPDSAGDLEGLQPAALPPMETPEHVLGTLYVFEGSTLGGQVMTRHVERAFGLQGGAGCRYFSSYGADVGRRWQEFRERLIAEQGSAAREEAIVAGARATFDCLHAWFSLEPARR